MRTDRARLRWNGWGLRDRGLGIGDAREAVVAEGLGARIGRPLAITPRPAARLEDAEVPPSRLDPGVRARLVEILGNDAVDDRDGVRAFHAGGQSLIDLFRRRSGRLRRAPDAVIAPGTSEDVAAALRVAAEAGVAVVPFGGGSSVVGGVDPAPGPGREAVVALDTTRLDRFLELDEESGIARFEAGIFGPELEAALGERGHTLGHFPQSFEHSTLGGWIAARSSGQQSDGYGGIDELLVAARMVTPVGEIRTLEVPRRSAGPEVRELILGSEGTLGVIVEASLRVRRKPGRIAVRGMLFRRWEDGSAAIRSLRDAGVSVSMARLSDAAETDFGVLLQTDPTRRVDLKRAALDATRAFGYGADRCLMLYAAEGDDSRGVSATLSRVLAIGAHHGGLPLGSAAGRSWVAHRFHTPYLRDWLLDRGVAIETLETSVPWSRLDGAHDSVLGALRRAIEAEAGGGIAMGHLSHSYRDGACLYFIVVYPYVDGGKDGGDAAVAQWQRIKDAAMDAVVAAGGTVSHHHGVGTDHKRWLVGEVGDLGIDALRGLKARLDPTGIMNPGKLW